LNQERRNPFVPEIFESGGEEPIFPESFESESQEPAFPRKRSRVSVMDAAAAWDEDVAREWVLVME
jgi:hypothetical protein